MLPKVGVGVIILKEGKVLMGKRLSKHGKGTWAFPGGHLEFGESVADCAMREVLEETGLKIQNLRDGPFTNNIYEDEGNHYVTLFVIADYVSGEAEILEKEKCAGWEWFDWDQMPAPLFLSVKNLVDKGFKPIKLPKLC